MTTHFDDTYLIKENQDVEKKIINILFFFFFSLNFRNVQIDVESFVFCLLDDTKNDANIFFFFMIQFFVIKSTINESVSCECK